MFALLCFVVAVLAAPFKSKSRLEAENAALRPQLIVLRRKLPGRVRLTNNDRWFFIQLYRWFPSILTALTIIQPATLVHWHRAGFRRYWRWKSRSQSPDQRTQVRLNLWPPFSCGLLLFSVPRSLNLRRLVGLFPASCHLLADAHLGCQRCNSTRHSFLTTYQITIGINIKTLGIFGSIN